MKDALSENYMRRCPYTSLRPGHFAKMYSLNIEHWKLSIWTFLMYNHETFNGKCSIFKDRLIQQFQNQNGYTIHQCDDKNPFGCTVPVCIDIQRKQNNIGQQRKWPDWSDQFIVIKKFIQEITERGSGKFNKINHHQSKQRTYQSQY